MALDLRRAWALERLVLAMSMSELCLVVAIVSLATDGRIVLESRLLETGQLAFRHIMPIRAGCIGCALPQVEQPQWAVSSQSDLLLTVARGLDRITGQPVAAVTCKGEGYLEQLQVTPRSSPLLLVQHPLGLGLADQARPL